MKGNANANIKLMLVGNKSDLSSERAVQVDEGKSFAEQHGLAFIEVCKVLGYRVRVITGKNRPRRKVGIQLMKHLSKSSKRYLTNTCRG